MQVVLTVRKVPAIKKFVQQEKLYRRKEVVVGIETKEARVSAITFERDYK